jgi:hypothetical protein
MIDLLSVNKNRKWLLLIYPVLCKPAAIPFMVAAKA